LAEQIVASMVKIGMIKLEDHLGRRFEKLRISLLNTCNFSCVYCVSDSMASAYQNVVFAPKTEQLDPEEFASLIEAVHKLTGIKSIRLTGGEPLLYMQLIQLVEKIRSIGIEDIRLTTNGYYLKQRSAELFDAGVTSVNISVDAIDQEIFSSISRHPNTARVFQGIEAALNVGMNVKLNAVIMRGKNDSQILPLLDYATDLGVKIRFLELMKMGHLYHSENGLFFSEKEMLSVIQEKYTIEMIRREDSETAHYWRTSGGGTFGIIANESTPFCHDCNRLRMDSNGYFYGCLSNAHGEKLSPYVHDEEMLTEKLRGLLRLKQPVRFHGSELSMRNIGG
jgi:cyclic pyranopterin phosphate synthase